MWWQYSFIEWSGQIVDATLNVVGVDDFMSDCRLVVNVQYGLKSVSVSLSASYFEHISFVQYPILCRTAMLSLIV